MAAFLAGVAENRGGQTSARWLFTILRKPTYSRYENVFSQRACRNPVRDDGADQIFQTILCLHFKSSTGDLDAIFSSRRTRA